MYDIVALGESLIDFTPAGINEMGMPLFSQNPGGAPANILAMASKLGRSTAFVGKVGRDAFGRFLQEHMEKAGIDCSALRRDDRVPTTLAFVQLDEYGDRSFSFYRDPGADVMLRPEEVDEHPVGGVPDIPLWLRLPHQGALPRNHPVGRTEGQGGGGSYQL